MKVRVCKTTAATMAALLIMGSVLVTGVAAPDIAEDSPFLLQAYPELKGNPAALTDMLRDTAGDSGFPDSINPFDEFDNRITTQECYSTTTAGWTFDWPGDIAIDREGYVYVADSGNHCIRKFTSDGVYVATWGSAGAGESAFWWPYGIALDQDGYIYVADTYNHRIQKLSSGGQFVTSWGDEGVGEAEFFHPFGIAIDQDGCVYVADTGSHRIQKFTSEGQFVASWGSEGDGEGEFAYPFGIAVDHDGYVYATDYENHRIQKFTSSGQHVTSWGGEGVGEGEFAHAMDIAVDYDGYVYVTDHDEHRVQKFTSDGEYVTNWGREGADEGEFTNPMGIAVDQDGYVYVADRGNNRVQKFTSDGEFVPWESPWAWTQRCLGTTCRLLDVVWSGTEFVVVGENGTILTSPDGVEWTQRNSGTEMTLRGVTWDGSQFVAVGGRGFILTSTDGVEWKAQILRHPDLLPGSIAWSGDLLVAVGRYELLWSSDGAQWSYYRSTAAPWLLDVTWGDNKFVAVGVEDYSDEWSIEYGYIMTSPDGSWGTWTERHSGVAGSYSWIRGVTWGGGQFVAVGNRGLVLTSTDGVTWTRRSWLQYNLLLDVTWGSNQYVAVGGHGTILTSQDALEWTERYSWPYIYLDGVTWGNSQFVAVGSGGIILTSPGYPTGQYNLTVESADGGEVTDPGEDTFTYDAGTVVDLVATPDTGYQFVNWTGDVDDIADVDAASTFITMNGDYTITANFAPIPIYELTMTSEPGTGGVALDLTGESPYPEGAEVSIQAIAGEGYEFTGWTAQAGEFEDACAETTIFTMPAQHISVTATFVEVVEMQMSLKAGWNLVSVPVIPDDSSVEAVFPETEVVYAWDASTGGYDMAAEVEPSKGYWVAVLSDTVITLSGVPVYDWTDEVTAGWNLVGSVFGSVDFTEPDTEPPGMVEGFSYRWNPDLPGYTFSTTKEPAMGHWIAATGDCVLTLSIQDG